MEHGLLDDAGSGSEEDSANAIRILAKTVRSCTVKFEHCQIACWDRYEVVIKEK